MWSVHGAQLARRIVSEEGAGRIVGPRLGHFHLRLLRTNGQGGVSRGGELSALGASSVFQRIARGSMESLRGDVADRARGPASASFHLGSKGRLQDRLRKLASCASWRNRKLRRDRRKCVCPGLQGKPAEFLIRRTKRLLQHGVIPGSCHTEAQGISSPGTHEAVSMWPRNDGEQQWNAMWDWTYR